MASLAAERRNDRNGPDKASWAHTPGIARLGFSPAHARPEPQLEVSEILGEDSNSRRQVARTCAVKLGADWIMRGVVFVIATVVAAIRPMRLVPNLRLRPALSKAHS